MSATLTVKRCAWALSSEQYQAYHDKKWGVPVHYDRKLFEMLILEGVQAFDGFDAHKIAQYDDRKVLELLANPEILRNRLKIQATIQNTRAFLELQS